MGWPRTLALVRHAESEGNVRGVNERAAYEVATHRYNLTERGRKQAEITGQWLREHYGTFDVRYVSYYNRSAETMRIMCPDEHVYEDPRLAEAQRGIWHTMTAAQMQERFPEEVARKAKEGLYHYRPWGGENWPDIELRIHSFLGTLSRDYDDQNVLIVVHGHWLILFRRLIEHFSIDEAVQQYEHHVTENASVTVFEDRRENGKSRLAFKEHVVPWQGQA
jgi:broad specificity phosphatase PhoE